MKKIVIILLCTQLFYAADNIQKAPVDSRAASSRLVTGAIVIDSYLSKIPAQHAQSIRQQPSAEKKDITVPKVPIGKKLRDVRKDSDSLWTPK